MKVSHLQGLLQLHMDYGLTLTDLRDMFKGCRTVGQIDEWINKMREHLSDNEVPLAVLMGALERLKNEDTLAVPSVEVARATTPALVPFFPYRLEARLKAVVTIVGERWLRVEDTGHVIMHQTADQVMAELDRQIGLLEFEESS